jgi:hypothetical protein
MPGLTFQLQRSAARDFRDPLDLEVGPDRASYVSGLREGESYFRVRAVAADGKVGPWSETLVVQVAYPPRSQVFLLMGVGAILLVATVMLILTGHARHRRREGA